MSTPEPMTTCPSDETLAAFVDKRLDESARQSVIEHTASCPDCFAITTAAWDFQQTDEGKVVQFHPRSSRKGLFAVAAIAAAAVIVFQAPIREYRAMRSLASASGQLQYRPVKSRVSGDFPYKPAKPTMRSALDVESPKDPHEWNMITTAGKIAEKTQAQSSPRAQRLHGIALLFLGQHDLAIDALSKALTTSSDIQDVHGAIAKSDDARLLNDVAAAYYARGRADDLRIAAEAVERSWSLRKMPEAGFNRALIYEALGDDEKARAAWADSIAIEGNSPWAEEAKTRLSRLQE